MPNDLISRSEAIEAINAFDWLGIATRAELEAALRSLPSAALDQLPAGEGAYHEMHTFGPHKGYFGAATWSEWQFHGEVLMEHDVVTFAAATVEGLEAAFRESVDVYLKADNDMSGDAAKEN